MTSRKKPGVAFWATVVVVVVLVGYPLSFGPACWAVSRADADDHWLLVVYKPIIARLSRPQTRIGRAIERYAGWGAADGWAWRLATRQIPPTWRYHRRGPPGFSAPPSLGSHR